MADDCLEEKKTEKMIKLKLRDCFLFVFERESTTFHMFEAHESRETKNIEGFKYFIYKRKVYSHYSLVIKTIFFLRKNSLFSKFDENNILNVQNFLKILFLF